MVVSLYNKDPYIYVYMYGGQHPIYIGFRLYKGLGL